MSYDFAFRLLLAEDSADDAELIELALRDGGLDFEVERVFDENGFQEALGRNPDVIISDYVMPQFDAPRALFLTRQLRPGTPLLVVSRAVGEDAAVETMRQGAADYLLKDRLTRLPAAVLRALERRRLEAQMQQTEQALSASQEFCREVLKALPMVLAIVDPQGRIKAVNRQAPGLPTASHPALLPGGSIDQVLGQMLSGNDPALAHARAGLHEIMQGGRRQFAGDYRIESATSQRWFSLKASAVGTPAGEMVVALEEITQRKRAEEALLIREQAIDSSANAVVIVDATTPHFPLTYVNRAFLQLTGRSPAEALGQPLAEIARATAHPAIWRKIQQALQDRCEVRGTIEIAGAGGKPCWCKATLAPVRMQDDTVSHFVGTLVDVTENRNYQLELERRTNFDTLTQLPNLSLCKDRLEQACQLARRQRTMVGVARIGIDRFEEINSSLGYKVGDQVLQRVAHTLRQHLPSGDTAARVGGDSFLLVVSGFADSAGFAEFLSVLRGDLCKPLAIDGQEVLLTVSIGAAFYPRDGVDADAVERSADLAAFRVKARGGNDIGYAQPEQTSRYRERLSLQAQLHRALEARQFELRYQPIVEQRSGAACAAEALVYWKHPRLGLLPPRAYLHAAERAGLGRELTLWALEAACRQLGSWAEAVPDRFRLALNITPATLLATDLAERAGSLLSAAGLNPAALEMEVGAGAGLLRPSELLGRLDALRELGIQISLDEFGSSTLGLSQLSRLPIDRLKVDRSLVSGLLHSHDDRSIVTGVVSIAKTLGLSTVADGVEREDQAQLMREMGFDELQGPLLSAPQDSDSFYQRWLAATA